MIVIVDYGLGNLKSIKNMFKKIGYESIITSDHEEIKNAKVLILPGVGAFDAGMDNIDNLGFRELLHQKAIIEKTPILGICLGMQLLTKRSDEGMKDGLGFIDAETIAFKFDDNSLRIPHMGWNVTKIAKPSILFENTKEENRFYFVHSYYVDCKNKEDVLTATHYGIDFVSSFAKNNIFGVQFHPEKSHKYGMKLLNNFIKNINVTA